MLQNNPNLPNPAFPPSTPSALNSSHPLPLTCVNPSLILLCLKVLANFSSSSRSLGSSEAPAGVRCFATCKCWGTSRWGSTEEPGRPERPTACPNTPKEMLRVAKIEKPPRFLCLLPSLKQQRGVHHTALRCGVTWEARLGPGWERRRLPCC